VRADFERQILSGIAELKLRRADPTKPLLLDTRDLDIRQVLSQNAPVPFRIGSPDAVLGSSLEIDLPASADSVIIHYASSPLARGLQWLAPEQTTGRSHPFLSARTNQFTRGVGSDPGFSRHPHDV